MADLSNLVQKAFYLGVGIASYAAEKGGTTIQELRVQAQKVADEMVARGEITAEEARKYVDDMIQQAQQSESNEKKKTEQKEPRLIEIVTEEDDNNTDTSKQENLDNLKQQVESLQEELNRLKRK
ncbi:phasin family protein [Crocosphaera sp. Alani8]|uniref:phasin family protein n=1 Tax=Crocosphaera sp. Alani8 TaxID=3038952 RepID=UPI00313E0EFA